VAQAIDDAGRPPGDPDHLDRPDRRADGSEQQHIDDQQQTHALPGEAAVEIALDPVVRRAVAVLDHGLGIARLGAVELDAGQQQGLETARLRGVRVFLGLALGVVLAVDGDELLGHHARAQPQPEAEEMRRHGVQVERAVGLGAMQENRDAADRDVRRDEHEQEHLPPSRVQQAMREPRHERVAQHRQFIHRDPEPGFRSCRL